MKRNFADYVVALAVIACSLVLLGALTIALSGWRVNKSTRTLQIDYSDVTGIHLHSELRYAGAPAGRVIAMRPLTSQERIATGEKASAIRVTVEIDQAIPALPADVIAGIGSDTLLSDKFIALSAGDPTGELLSSNAILHGQASASLDTLLSSAGPLLHNADVLLGELAPKLKDVFPEITKLMSEAHTLVSRTDKVIADNEGNLRMALEKLPKLVGDLQEMERNANSLLGNVDGFIGTTDRQLNARMLELRVVLDNLKVVTTQAKAITQTLGEKPSRLIWGLGKTNKLTSEQTILKSRAAVPAVQSSRAE
jgi:phospholipid/cholesterol/gamma-HCH transport system substrate-binding protein